MRGKIFLGILLILIILPAISAYDTEIKIKTHTDAEVQINVIDPSSGESLIFYDHLKGYSDEYGDVKFTYSSDYGTFDLTVLVKKNDARIAYEVFRENYIAGEPISIQIAKDGYDFVETPETENLDAELTETNETTLEDEAILEEGSEESGKGISGLAIFGDNFNWSKTIYSLIGALFILGIAGFLVARKVKKKKSGPKEIKVTKLSDMKQEKKEESSGDDDEDPRVKAAEEKIKEAQIELKKIKNDEKVRSMEKQIEKDRERLEKLRAGEDDD